MGFCHVLEKRMPPPCPRGRGSADSGGRPGLEINLLTVAGQRRTFFLQSTGFAFAPTHPGVLGTRAAINMYLNFTKYTDIRQAKNQRNFAWLDKKIKSCQSNNQLHTKLKFLLYAWKKVI